MRDEAERRTYAALQATAVVVGTCYRSASAVQSVKCVSMEGRKKMAAVHSERIDAGEPKFPAADPILVVENIVKRFETPDGVLTAVDHVSLNVAPGEFVGVIGPSGCGKSTLFNVIGGLLDGYDGMVRVAGERVRGPHPAIGMIFQEESTFPWRNLIDNVAFPLEIMGLPRAERYERARQFVKLVGLEGFERRYRRAVGRHAAAGVHGAHAGGAAKDPADGRAVRRA